MSPSNPVLMLAVVYSMLVPADALVVAKGKKKTPSSQGLSSGLSLSFTDQVLIVRATDGKNSRAKTKFSTHLL